MFPSHHGLVRIYALPAPYTILPPSDKSSTLRGVSSSASSGGGENNLAFKCMRKRMLFETLHLDLEGGVGERRTTPAATSTERSAPTGKGEATVKIELEEAPKSVKPKTKKRVGFANSVYDF
jgi:elongator complex protein 4